MALGVNRTRIVRGRFDLLRFLGVTVDTGGSATDRREVLATTGGRCARCGSTRKVTAHRVLGLADGGDNDLAGGLPLCSRCHAKVEAMVRG